MSDLDLYADLGAGKLTTPDGGAPILPPLFLGDVKRFTLRTLERNADGDVRERDLRVRTLAATLGNVMAPPAAGDFKLELEGTEVGPFTPATSIDDFKAALHAVEPVAIGLLSAPACWLVAFVDQDEFALLEAANALRPESLIRIRTYIESGRRWYEVRAIEAPLSWNIDGHERRLSDPPSITRTRAGTAATPSAPAVNEIQDMLFPREFRGTYFLRWNGRVTGVLGIEDGPDEIATALNALYKDGAERFVVTNAEADHEFIEFVGDLGGAPQALITVEVNSFLPGVLTFDLPLDFANLATALRVTPQIEVPLEVEIEIVEDDEDPGNPAIPGRIITLFQQNFKVVREQKWRELATVRAIDWLRPPLPRDYIPFTPDQVITGSQHYVAVVGDGVSFSVSCAHNLDVAVGQILVRENIADGRMLTPTGEYGVTFPSANEFVLHFAAPPALNSLVVSFVTPMTRDAFQAHTHTIGQIVGLQAALDALSDRVSDLEDMAPNVTFSEAEPGAPARQIVLPSRAEIFPGRFKTAPDPKNPKLKAGGLLPAIHDASVTSLTVLPLGDASANAGAVFQNNTGTAIAIPGGLGRRAAVLLHQGYFGSDGRLWYRLSRDASTTSYFPSDFERELWKIAINDKQLRAGQTLTVDCEVWLQLLVASTQMQCVLVIEIGTAPSQTSPATTGPNLENVVWSDTPLLAQRLIAGDVEERHEFGCTIARNGVGAISADASLYDAAIAATNTPASANFVLRAALKRWDTENRYNASTGPNSARGLISFRSVGTAEIK